MIEKFLRIIKDNIFLNNIDIIVDAGSRDLAQSIEFHKVFPNANIYAFECCPSNVKVCLKRIMNSNIHLSACALGNTNDKLIFNAPNLSKTDNKGRGSLGLYAIKKHRPLCDIQVEVQGITLDTFKERYIFRSVDLLWMDVQGNELNVLKGADGCLQEIRAIHLEAAKGKPVWEGMATWEEIDSYLSERSFDMVWNDFSMGKTGFIVGNCIYINERYKRLI